jgi:hypothetical protein
MRDWLICEVLLIVSHTGACLPQAVTKDAHVSPAKTFIITSLPVQAVSTCQAAFESLPQQ